MKRLLIVGLCLLLVAGCKPTNPDDAYITCSTPVLREMTRLIKTSVTPNNVATWVDDAQSVYKKLLRCPEPKDGYLLVSAKALRMSAYYLAEYGEALLKSGLALSEEECSYFCQRAEEYWRRMDRHSAIARAAWEIYYARWLEAHQ